MDGGLMGRNIAREMFARYENSMKWGISTTFKEERIIIMSIPEEKIVEQISEIASTPLKNFLEIRNNRKKMLIDYGTQQEIELIDKVMSSDTIDLENKAFLSSYIKSGAKKFYNQVKILGIALDKVNIHDKILEIDADWINDFWEKAKNISDEENQSIWGDVLYYNFINGVCTKTLLNSLYLLDKKGMNYFDSIRKFTFQHVDNPRRVYSCIYYSENTSTYKKYGLHKYSFYQLSTIGLIERDWNNKFVFPDKEMLIKYGNKMVKIESDHRLEYGNIRLTSDGSLLFNALQPQYSEECYEFCVNRWKKECNTIIEENFG